jgi:hypothetical protein
VINLSTLRSWEFVLLVLTNAAAWLANLANEGNVSNHDAVLISAASAGLYALARGFAKVNTDGKPIYMTTEFWVAILGAATAVAGKLTDTIGPTTTQELLGFIGALTAVANGLRTPPAQAVSGEVDGGAV